MLASPAVFAQGKDNPEQAKPGEKITVNKEYDEQGNLVRFDSTYVFVWFGDTMMAFPGGENFSLSPGVPIDMESFMHGFFSDSAFSSPFGDEWQNGFSQRQKDLMKRFDFPFAGPDSANTFFGNDSLFGFPFMFEDFDCPDISQFFKGFEGFGGQGQPFFEDEGQEKEWLELQQRHQKEMEELQQKWDSKNKSKPKADIKLQKI